MDGGAEAVRPGQLSSCISIRRALTCSQEVAQAYRMNGEGWTYQAQAIEKYVATAG